MTRPGYLYWNSTGHLIHPNTDGVYVNATSCNVNHWVNHYAIIFQMLFYVISFIPLLYLVKEIQFKKIKQINNKPQSNNVEPLLPKPKITVGKVAIAQILVSIVIFMVSDILQTTWTTRNLSINELDALNDSNNYLSPLSEVFQFFEDGMTVKVGQVMGGGDFVTAGLLMKFSAFGGFISGAIAAGFSLLFVFIPALFDLILSNEKSSLIKPYWVLKSLSWMFSFITNATIGFFLGTGETQFWAISSAAQCAAEIAVFWTLINNSSIQHTTTMGVKDLISPIVFLLFTLVCFGRKKYIRLFGLAKKNMFSRKAFTISKQVAMDGLRLMVKDLLLTLQRSISLIMASNIGIGSQYQLLIYNAVLNIFGYVKGSDTGSVFPVILGYGIRFQGSMYLGAAQYKEFGTMAKAYYFGSAIFGLISFALIIIFGSCLPYFYGSNTLCEYAEHESSIHILNQVLDKIDAGTIICGLICCVNTIFCVLQSTLYAALDFKYLRNCTIICFFCVYLPAAFVSYFKYKSVIGLLISTNAPFFILTVVYTYRLFFIVLPDVESFVQRKMVMDPNARRKSAYMQLFNRRGSIS